VDPTSSDVIKSMSTALAPSFLISGVGVLLGSMNVRYGRVIDRTRHVLAEAQKRTDSPRPAEIDTELRTLYGRARILRLTITLAVGSIFSLAVSIFLIFTNIVWNVSLPYALPSVFMVGLIFLIVSLGFLIQDFVTSLSALKLEMRVALGRDVANLENPNEEEK
jgi:hypothetical protein